MAYMNAFYAAVALQPVRLFGGIQINSGGQLHYYRLIAFWQIAVIRRLMKDFRNWMARTECFVVIL
jgi:hypothetical protein